MATPSLRITSPSNEKVKRVVKLRQRSHRDELGLMLVEGYREIRRCLDSGFKPVELYYSPSLFQGSNERAMIEDCRKAGAQLIECDRPVFEKMSYRDGPDGLLVVMPQLRRTLADLPVPERGMYLVAEAIEKPGNLGTMLRTADAAGVTAVIVCDRCTDICNPNVVRASTGTIFTVPVVEASSADTIAWLERHRIMAVAATPHADLLHTAVSYREPRVAFVLGAEQYGLSDAWLKRIDRKVRIPMMGKADSLNVAAAATILFYEALRQRSSS